MQPRPRGRAGLTTAPIASATTVAQLTALTGAAQLQLDAASVVAFAAASYARDPGAASSAP